MKLVRYGAPGREKPGILDADGKIRDLSRIVPDIDGDDAEIRRARQNPQGQYQAAESRSPASRGSGLASAPCAISSPSGSTMPTTPPRAACRCRTSR